MPAIANDAAKTLTLVKGVTAGPDGIPESAPIVNDQRKD